MDLSFPPHASVNIGIPDSSYLNEPYRIRLPGIDWLCEFILQLGHQTVSCFKFSDICFVFRFWYRLNARIHLITFIVSLLTSFFPFFSVLGSLQGLQWLDSFSDRLIRLAHAASMHSNMQSHRKLFTQFCHDLGHQPFPIQVATILRYLAFLSTSGRAFSTIQNHISSIQHFHALLGLHRRPTRSRTNSYLYLQK